MFLTLRFLGTFKDAGFLVLRIGLGLAMMIHGSGKVFGGVEVWTKVGGAMHHLGIEFGHTYWGFMAAFSEFGGGILLILGFLFRPAALLLFCTMGVALLMHIKSGDPFGTYSHALELAIVFLSLAFIGPGRFSIDGD